VDTISGSAFQAIMADQLIRSSTSAALNHGEAMAYLFSQDLTYRLKICLKEIRETRNSLMIVKKSDRFDRSIDVDLLLEEAGPDLCYALCSIRTIEQKR
jgi:four helix bundle protein